jgi:acyl-CoA reductase-like NAD-dependent aldehyde dehydrogenase
MALNVIPLLINGEEVSSDITFDIVNPGSGEVVFKANGANAEFAKKAVDAAQAAFPAWSKTKPLERRKLFMKAAQLVRERGDEITKIQQQETSVDAGFAGGFQLNVSAGMLEECAARVSTIEGSVPEPDEEGMTTDDDRLI